MTILPKQCYNIINGEIMETEMITRLDFIFNWEIFGFE